MPYCSSCGVEVDAAVKTCPLCTAPIHGGSLPAGEADRQFAAYPEHIIDPEDKYHLTGAERRRISVELITLSFSLAAGALGLADLLVNRRLGWSLYALTALAFAWLYAAMPFILFGKPWSLFSVLAPALPALLLALDTLDGRFDWFLNLGLPIAGASLGTIAATGALIQATKRKGLNVVATCFLGIAAFLLILEGILDLNQAGVLTPWWSGISALALAPVAVVLYFIHGRVLRGADLRKVFRL